MLSKEINKPYSDWKERSQTLCGDNIITYVENPLSSTEKIAIRTNN